MKVKKPGDMETVAVMFVEQTAGGLLAKCLQKAEDKVAKMVGYTVRMVESSGTQLCRLLPCTNPWSGKHCGREMCYTCEQGGDSLQNCRQRNIMYELVCMVCNKEEDNRDRKTDKFTRFKEQKGVYVGESARSIFERAREQRQDAADGSEDSHMIKH